MALILLYQVEAWLVGVNGWFVRWSAAVLSNRLKIAVLRVVDQVTWWFYQVSKLQSWQWNILELCLWLHTHKHTHTPAHSFCSTKRLIFCEKVFSLPSREPFHTHLNQLKTWVRDFQVQHAHTPHPCDKKCHSEHQTFFLLISCLAL